MASDTCIHVSGWRSNDCSTDMFTYIYLNTLYSPITTQQFAVHHVALTIDVQFLTHVHVSLDVQAVTL